MGRIADKFAYLKGIGRKAFIPYLTAGDPNLETTERLLLALADAGADIIELGVPFSDPMADGPVIQRASERALLNPIGVAEILPVVERVRGRIDLPLVLFTYFNPLLQFRSAGLGEALRGAGIDGVLVLDLIPEEADEFVAEMRGVGIDTIFLVAPTSTDERIELIGRYASGFIYVVARTGVTGVRETIGREIRELVARVRRHSELPVAVGFGISRPEHVAEVWEYADAAVVGSRVVLEIEAHLESADLVQQVAQLTREMAGG
jgi:tryptophan synthase alpha chain